MKLAFPAVLVAGGVLFLCLLGGCLPQGSSVLVNENVFVGAGGGFAEVTFDNTGGQRIRITLMATASTQQPYAYLRSPDGLGAYFPPQVTAVDGVNTGDGVLSQTGQYRLIVYDGSNAGGVVYVVVKKL